MFAISVSLYRIRSSFTHIQGELRRCGVCRNVHRDCHKSAVGCENEVRTNIHIWYHRLILCVCASAETHKKTQHEFFVTHANGAASSSGANERRY